MPLFCIMHSATIGAAKSEPSISSPWKKSVQHTALKPPRNTYTRMMAVAIIMAVLALMPVTVLNSVPQAEMLEAL